MSEKIYKKYWFSFVLYIYVFYDNLILKIIK
jgi:hypothetical protein